MRARTLAEVAATVHGRLAAPGAEDAVVDSVATDSRAVETGTLFVARRGERTDGSVFVAAVLAAGAGGALVGPDAAVGEAPRARLVEVADPGRALLDLAADERDGLAARVVAITGSSGKTCTKDFIAAVLGERLRVAANQASFNNEVGLPLTLLSAPADREALVLEMGSRGPGHLRLLCEVARPHVGVITNVGEAHLELFGTREVLRDAKAELIESLPPEGTAVLNADDAVVRAFTARTPARSVLYGRAADAAIRGEDVALDRETGRAGFRLVTPNGTAAVRLPVAGEHMVANALAAAAVGFVLGLGPEETAAGLGRAAVSGGRMEVLRTPGGLRIVNDAYNANPTSMAAALRAARWMAGDGRCVAVLGHMAELGEIGPVEHERLGELLARLRVDELVTVGEEARRIAVGAEREGVEPERIHPCLDVEEAVAAVRALARPGDLVLVKASRVARLERLVEALGAQTAAARPAGEDAVPANGAAR